ncbi:MAG: chromate transporter [Peptococcaceae bacterium]|jgi:chromate transporter|nr:chromate transporter [Peptococcaceae bacterium]
MTGYRKLFFTFAKIGLFTFGGGYAMLPMIQREVADVNGWANEQELVNYYAIGQCTPGIFAVNLSTIIGYKQRGIKGALTATLGMIFPSLVIIICVASVLGRFAEYEAVQHAMAGIRAGVAALIISTVFKLGKSAVRDGFGAAVCAVSFVLSAVFLLSPVYVVTAAALLGILREAVFFKRKRT